MLSLLLTAYAVLWLAITSYRHKTMVALLENGRSELARDLRDLPAAIVAAQVRHTAWQLWEDREAYPDGSMPDGTEMEKEYLSEKLDALHGHLGTEEQAASLEQRLHDIAIVEYARAQRIGDRRASFITAIAGGPTLAAERLTQAFGTGVALFLAQGWAKEADDKRWPAVVTILQGKS